MNWIPPAVATAVGAGAGVMNKVDNKASRWYCGAHEYRTYYAAGGVTVTVAGGPGASCNCGGCSGSSGASPVLPTTPPSTPASPVSCPGYPEWFAGASAATKFATQIFFDLLGRFPDQASAEGVWTGIMNQGGATKVAYSLAFDPQDEMVNYFGSLGGVGCSEYVKVCYRKLLGREVETPAGLAEWTDYCNQNGPP